MGSLNRGSLLTVTLVLEGALLLVSAVWIVLAQIPLLPKLTYNNSAIFYGLATGLGTVLVSMACITLGKNLPLLRELRKMSEEFLGPLVANLGLFDIILLSLVSGFCEEIFFRGILQAQFGVVAASVIFGIFHDPSLKQKAYVILAALAGLALGYLYQATGNLWSCIVAHVFHNAVSMLILRYWIKPDKNC